MTSSQILRLYKNTIRITEWSAKARQLFKQWKVQPDATRLMIADTETTGVIFHEPTILKHGRMEISCPGPVIFGISLCLPIDDQLVLVWARMETPLYDEVVKLLNYASIKAAHNARYDIRMFQEEDIKMAGQFECTQTMSRIIYDRRMKHSLQSLVEMWCPELSDWEVALKKEWTRLQTASTRSGNPKGYTNYSFLPDELVGPYSMCDSFHTYIGYRILWPIIQETFMEVYERERKVYYIINEVEKRGLAFDARKAQHLAEHPRREMEKSCEKMFELAGEFNPNYPKGVLDTLELLGVPQQDLMLKGKRTGEADVLKRASKRSKKKRVKKFIKNLLIYRGHIKIVNTYLDPLSRRSGMCDGIVYCSINPTDTITGRMMSKSPNLQNIPNPIARKSGHENPVRACFHPRRGCHIYYPDYSQMEIAVFGLYAGENRILDAYADGEDIHGTMASYIYGNAYTDHQRGVTKNISFGIIYGMGIRAMALMYEMEEDEARRHVKTYFGEFPSIKTFQNQCEEELKQYGYVEDFFGRRYHVSVPEAYKAVNCLVQGGCAQAFKIGLIQVDEFLQSWEFLGHIILPVHDEIQIETKILTRKVEKMFCRGIVERMTNILQLLDRGLQLRVDVKKSTSNWAEKVKVEF